VLIVTTATCLSNSRKGDIFAFVIEHEVLLSNAALEMKNAEWDFEEQRWQNISVTDIESEILRSALELNGLCKITIVKTGVDFCFGGSRQFQSGFYYSNDGTPIFILDGARVDFTQHNDGWIYRFGGNSFFTERIVGNFFYYEMRW